MKITNAQYMKDYENKEVVTIKCDVGSTTWYVPLEPDNTDYAEIMRQVKEGTLTIKDAE
mgnify:CR=1 FL=1